MYNERVWLGLGLGWAWALGFGPWAWYLVCNKSRDRIGDLIDPHVLLGLVGKHKNEWRWSSNELKPKPPFLGYERERISVCERDYAILNLILSLNLFCTYIARILASSKRVRCSMEECPSSGTWSWRCVW